MMIAVGLWFMNHAMESYSIGTLRRMGPGFFPAVLGGLIAVFGVLIALPAFFREGDPLGFEGRPFLMVCLSIGVFAFVLERLGMVPAIFALVFCAAFAKPGPNLIENLGLSVFLAVAAVAVFIWGLGIPIQAFRWNI
ncbi:tripartite tricarboxylate transporter TctB family protein [Roseococcus microcysteis]|nr:tripartite tricarboxylate transporter TctB family protein [Roseococcus microcysteis]